MGNDKKKFDIFEPKKVFIVYFIISGIIAALKFFGYGANDYYMTALAIISFLFVVISTWNERNLSIAIIGGLVIFFLFNLFPFPEEKIPVVNDLITIFVFNFTIFWLLFLNKKRTEEKNHRDYMNEGKNGDLYQALDKYLKSGWVYDATPEQEEKFWEAIESLHYNGAPRKEDYKD
ncbi:hypothetical protein [Bacillus mobilis]|uniref:hypothetical protein n=1 Tax=Bacillus mobilis TaxID=2026190 RepID=UPI003CF00CD6